MTIIVVVCSYFSHYVHDTCVKYKYKACKLDTINPAFQEAVWCIVNVPL